VLHMKLLQNFSPGIQKINKNGETENEKKFVAYIPLSVGRKDLPSIIWQIVCRKLRKKNTKINLK